MATRRATTNGKGSARPVRLSPPRRRIPSAALAVASAIAMAAGLVGAPAVAQEAAAPAESLFQEGRALIAAGRFAEACPKFAASEKLDPAVGTLLNLGDCYEHMGKVATAWATFKQAAAMAREGKQPAREKIAADRASVLEPKIPRLSIRGPESATGLQVRRDGVLVEPAEWSALAPSAVAVDPGDHEITATAPGRKAWSTKVTLAADGKTTSVDVPALEADELAERAPLKPATQDTSVEAVTTHDRDVQRAIAIVVGSAGIVTALVGIPFGLRAISYNNSAKNECPTNTTCMSPGQSDSQTAVTSGTISTVLFIAGGVVTAGGVVLFLTAPQPRRETRAAVRVVPSIDARGGGLAVLGTF